MFRINLRRESKAKTASRGCFCVLSISFSYVILWIRGGLNMKPSHLLIAAPLAMFALFATAILTDSPEARVARAKEERAWKAGEYNRLSEFIVYFKDNRPKGGICYGSLDLSTDHDKSLFVVDCDKVKDLLVNKWKPPPKWSGFFICNYFLLALERSLLNRDLLREALFAWMTCFLAALSKAA